MSMELPLVAPLRREPRETILEDLPADHTRLSKVPPIQRTPRRVLCFDIENKPGTHGLGDYTHKKVTAIACQFLDETEPHVWSVHWRNKQWVARQFLKQWEQADAVMGHFIRKHDMRLIQGFFIMADMPPLPAKRMIDTFLDVEPKTTGYSKSLENLCARWGCPISKLHVPEHAWDAAYDGVPEYVEIMRQRAVTDVQMTIWLYNEIPKRQMRLR